MKKNLIIVSIIFLLLILYLIFSSKLNIYIPCLFRIHTHLYCPGCGVTRMIFSILDGNFYQAFRYNMVLFVLSPFILFFIINYIYASIKNKEPLYKKVPDYVWIILIIILVLFAIVRNIFPYFAPTVI